MQLEALAVVLKLPLVHALQARSVVAVPDTATSCPGTQLVHAMHAVAALPSWSQVPLAHDCFGVAPPAQYVPASHPVHTGGEVCVPADVCSVPAAQASPA